MKVTSVRSDSVYEKIMLAPADKKNDIYRYELMMPFRTCFDYRSIPMKAASSGGYDVVMASAMLGHLPPVRIDHSRAEEIKAISRNRLWNDCQTAIEHSLAAFTTAGINLPVKEYLWTILLADETSPYTIMNEGYCGDGGIPGYLFAWLSPNEYTLRLLPVAIAHEVNHNVRFQFIPWRSDITLGEMMVSEGLAENFAVWLYGEENAGPWVTKTDMEELCDYVKPLIREALGVQGMMEMNAYLYGDEMAMLQGARPEGMPYCAGYACGYHLVKYYLEKTGKSIVKATILPAEEILKEAEGFWDER